MKVLFNDLKSNCSSYSSGIKAAIDRVLDSGWFVLGEENTNFEREFSEYLGVKHVVGVANATDALLIAIRVLSHRKDGIVATVANAGFYSSTAARNAQKQIIYMDVDINTHLVTLTDVEEAVGRGAEIIIATHLYGNVIPEIREISEYCKQNNVFLIEDCSQAHGASIDGEKVGSFGDIACFSFYPTKNLGALGDGGAIATNNDEINAITRKIRQYGWKKKYVVEEEGGGNSRLDEMQAAILRELLPYLDTMNNSRINIVKMYEKGISNKKIIKPKVVAGESVAHLYVIRSQERVSLKSYLENMSIQTDIHYPIPDHRQPIWNGGYSNLILPNTELLANEVLSLPCYPSLTQDQVEYVIDSVNGWR